MSRCKPLPDVIGTFKVIKDLGYDGRRRWALFLCPLCLQECKKRVDAIKNYDSCGCSWKTPGISLRLQRIHNGMMSRCYRKNHMHYNRYGGSGIITCPEWLNSKTFFYYFLCPSPTSPLADCKVYFIIVDLLMVFVRGLFKGMY